MLWASLEFSQRPSPSKRFSSSNASPQGFSEILYTYSSATADNGSAYAGLPANPSSGDSHFNVTLAVAMLIGRFFMIISTLALNRKLF